MVEWRRDEQQAHKSLPEFKERSTSALDWQFRSVRAERIPSEGMAVVDTSPAEGFSAYSPDCGVEPHGEKADQALRSVFSSSNLFLTHVPMAATVTTRPPTIKPAIRPHSTVSVPLSFEKNDFSRLLFISETPFTPVGIDSNTLRCAPTRTHTQVAPLVHQTKSGESCNPVSGIFALRRATS